MWDTLSTPSPLSVTYSHMKYESSILLQCDKGYIIPSVYLIRNIIFVALKNQKDKIYFPENR